MTGGNFRFDVFGLIFGGGQFLYFYGLRYHYRADTYLRHSNDIRDTRPTLNFIASKEKISFPFWINPFPRGKKEKAPGLYIHARRPLSRRSFNYSNTLTWGNTGRCRHTCGENKKCPFNGNDFICLLFFFRPKEADGEIERPTRTVRVVGILIHGSLKNGQFVYMRCCYHLAHIHGEVQAPGHDVPAPQLHVLHRCVYL